VKLFSNITKMTIDFTFKIHRLLGKRRGVFSPKDRSIPYTALAILALSSANAHAAAPTPTVTISAIDLNSPALGIVVSAASGDTVFRVAASDGSVTKISGAGSRLTAGTTRALVTVACTGGGVNACPNSVTTVTITGGATTGRARTLTNFTVAGGPSPPTLGAVTGTGPITFTISGIPRDGTRNFYVGADFGIGDNSSGATGAASAAFTVSIPGSSLGGTAIATVYRPLSIAADAELAFGAIVRPTSGSGTVQINASDNQRVVAGTGVVGIASTFNRAAFSISGEGGQAVSVSVLSSFNMTGPGAPITVTTNNVGAGTQTLSSSLGSQGNGTTVYVGGSFPFNNTTATGPYSGSYQVTVQYN
jgi:hypothetical protein